MKRFNKILCVVESNDTLRTAVNHANSIAQEHQANVVYLSVLRDTSHWRSVFKTRDDYEKQAGTFEENHRQHLARDIEAITGVRTEDVLIKKGTAFLEIIKTAIEDDFDLVVKCAEDMDWMDRMMGSDDVHILRKCPCPVLMLKPGDSKGFRRILATVDVNDSDLVAPAGRVQIDLNKKVLDYSSALSLVNLNELHLGSIWEAYAEDFFRGTTLAGLSDDRISNYVNQVKGVCEEELAQLLDYLKVALGDETFNHLQPQLHLEKGIPSREIPKLAITLDIDLIVMGTVGRVGIPGLFIGNTAEAIIEQAKCSVLAIKPEGFQSPVTAT